jgi:hydroxyacylglutathione hydrolase
VLVDPGDAKPAIHYLEQQGVQLTGILVTHHHSDHTGGLQELSAWALSRGADCPIYGPTSERIPARSHAVREGDVLQLRVGGLSVSVCRRRARECSGVL